MKINSDQLQSNLSKKIYPVYLVSGNEPLVVQESSELIRKHLGNVGYSERVVFYLETSFNWGDFLASVNNISLFAEQTLIELRLKGKLGDKGSKVIQEYLKHPASDKVLLIISDKLDSGSLRSSWFKAIDVVGLVVQVWPIDQAKFLPWLANRLKLAGVTLDRDSLQLLAGYCAGNLLAAIQEIEKLILLYGQGRIDAEQIAKAIADNARFDIFDLLDVALAGDVAAAHRILLSLKSEDVEPVMILWAIVNELRTLIKVRGSIDQGTNIEQAMVVNNVWYNRKLLVRKMVNKFNLSKLQHILQQAAKVEMVIKGQDRKRLVWHELERLYLELGR